MEAPRESGNEWNDGGGDGDYGRAAVPGGDVLDFEPVAVRGRHDGWTPRRQREFIEALADHGIVRYAAERVGMSEQSARRLRRRADAAAFNRAWQAALRLGAETLREIACERAVKGSVKSHYYRGELVGNDIVYDNRLLMFLIKSEEGAREDKDVQEVIRNWDGWMGALEDGVEAPPTQPDEAGKPRAWTDSKGRWWTNFPPPPDYEGEQVGLFGQGGYRRHCGAGELDDLRALKARRENEERRRRDLYFARLRSVPPPT